MEQTAGGDSFAGSFHSLQELCARAETAIDAKWYKQLRKQHTGCDLTFFVLADSAEDLSNKYRDHCKKGAA